MMRFLRFVMIVGVCFVMPAAAEQSVSTAAPIKTPAWSNEAKYQECGQSCIYQKGNENLSLDATYVMNKLGLLNQKKDDGEEVFKTLHGYCREGEESAADCVERYTYYEIARLQKARVAIGSNEDAVYQLKNNKGQKNVAPVNARHVSGKKLPQTPEFLTNEEIESAAKLYDVDLSGYNQWLKEEIVQPEEDDYRRFVVKDANVKDKKSGQVSVIDTSAKGETEKKKRYEKAKADFEVNVNNRLTWDDAINGINYKDRKKVVQKNPKPSLTDTEKDAFNQARDLVVETANKAIIESGLAAGAGGRAPAGRTQRLRGVAEAPSASVRDASGRVQPLPVKPMEGAESRATVTWSPDDLEQAIQELKAP